MKKKFIASFPLITIALFCAAFACNTLADLTLHYTFDSDFSDSSLSDNTGTPNGSAVITNDSDVVICGSGSLALDGADTSYVSLSNAVTLATETAWSISFWAQRSDIGDSKGMVLGNPSDDSNFIWLNDSQTGFRFRSSTGTTVDFTAPMDTEVHHYVLIAEGNGTMSLYLDGSFLANKSASTTGFSITSIGDAYHNTSYHLNFKGILDDIRIYNNALSETIIESLYLDGQIKLLHYRFDEDFSDSTASGNDGTPGGNAALTFDPSQVFVTPGALSLDGNNAIVALSKSITFTNGKPWTAAFWAQRGEIGSGKAMIMGKANTYTDFIWLNDNFDGFRFRSSKTNTVDFTATQDLLPHHYALVAEGDGTMSLYIDGEFSANQAAWDTSLTIDTIGQGYFTGNNLSFQGVLDDVCIYSYALAADDVTGLFAMGGSQKLHYAFEGDMTDSSPYGNDGTGSGNAALTAEGAMVGATALTLDGLSTSYVTPDSPITFADGEPWSTAFWVQRAGNANQGMVMGDPTDSRDFIWVTDNFEGFRFRSSGDNTLDFTGPKDLNQHHYALVSEGDGTMSLYIDGVFSTNKNATTTSFEIKTIGKAYDNSDYNFKGLLDDVRVFDYALAATNVTELYKLGDLEPPEPPVTVTNVHVFLQGGQSNSEGRADPTLLPTNPVNLQGYQSDVDFYYYAIGSLSTLHPATSGGTQFGPEITCGRQLVDLMQPDPSNRVAIIKYAIGGTDLYEEWKAGGDATTTGDGPRYVSFQSTVTSGLAALAAAYPDAEINIEGMIWMQGESDATETYAPSYYDNLTNFIADVRLTYALPNLPFIVGRLSVLQTGAGTEALRNIIRQAQTDAAANDAWTGLVDTDTFAVKTDNLHFNADGQQSMGYAFAEQLLYLKGIEGLFTPEQLAAGAAEPDADPDGDGMNNWDEYLAGTDASSASSLLAFTEPASSAEGDVRVIRWSSVAGRIYTVERSTNLVTDAFSPLAEDLPAVPPINVYTDTAPSSVKGFYRIRAERP